MITFNVVEDQRGWTIKVGERMSTPFWSRALAIQEANCLAGAIRRHGQGTEVLVHCSDTLRIDETGPKRLSELLRSRAQNT